MPPQMRTLIHGCTLRPTDLTSSHDHSRGRNESTVSRIRTLGTRVTRTASLCLLAFYLNLFKFYCQDPKDKLGVCLGCSSQCGHIQYTVFPLISRYFFAGISAWVSNREARCRGSAQQGNAILCLLRATSTITILPHPAMERGGSS